MAFDFSGVEPSDVLAVAAVIVSVALFSIGYTRSKKSEQIRISRDLWDGIRTQSRIIHEWPLKNDSTPQSRMDLIRTLDSLENDLRYFVYLIKKKEIKEPIIKEYYQKQLRDVDVDANVKLIGRQHPEMKRYTQEIIDLIKEYDSLAGKKRKYKIGFE